MPYGEVAAEVVLFLILIGFVALRRAARRSRSRERHRAVAQGRPAKLRVRAWGRGEGDPPPWTWGTIALGSDRTVWVDERGSSGPMDLTDLVVTRLRRPHQRGGPTQDDTILMGHLAGRQIELAVYTADLDLLLDALPGKELGRRARSGAQQSWISLLRQRFRR
ncbi:hypothetical protein [Prauserella muralis]|uniref:Uncharacterized protein n=1 Tax=Prauserella muralis TaxID=588067 RepID=A0A2V4APG3_9PSEU|nr:hypothetical protein [Prauserella muralis]PXY22467.1 hypothetical protein BAY60_21710 [Prauserella muralis]TWE28145.1 hypothetical protein FHX69_0796 [Prauserella muralis]